MPNDQQTTVPAERQLLAGWGRTPSAYSAVIRPQNAAQVQEVFSRPQQRGVIARGLGRSYGDAAQRAGGLVLDMTGLQGIGEIDPTTGHISVEGGVSIDALLRQILPQGWFVPVTAGTRQVTIGGAIAADIHGKNHHRDGSFCSHVASLTLVTPTGVHEVTPEDSPDLFWATSGGMGLTGIVTRATIVLQPVDTSWVMVDTIKFATLSELMDTMITTDVDYHYSVAWVDCNSSGRRRGRSILTRGDHASAAQCASLPDERVHQPLAATRLAVPRTAPRGLLNMASVAAFNELWFRRAPKRREAELQHIGTFFHPLDGLSQWNLMYGPDGFLQYQFVVNDAQGAAVEEAIAMISHAKVPSFLAVLKRFGPGDEGYLSFPTAGWTLALDFPVGPSRVPDLVRQLDVLVADAGGRIYLAKDSRIPAARIHEMYPQLSKLQKVRAQVDPEGMLCSDLSLRLEI